MAARHLQSQMRDNAHAGREAAVSSQSKGDGRQRTTHSAALSHLCSLQCDITSRRWQQYTTSSAALSHLCSLHWVQSRSMTSGVFLVFYV